MDLSGITDIKELKALAYDCIAIMEQGQRAQQELEKINARIAEVASSEQEPAQKDKKTIDKK